MANLSAVIYGKQDIRIEDRPIKEPGYGEVQLAIKDVGVCGSDTHMYNHGEYGMHAVTGPGVIGHEASAVVTKLGQGVHKLKIGDRVCLEPGNACNECKRCTEGRHNLCLTDQAYMGLAFEGYITRTTVYKEAYCHILPGNVSFEEGTFIEPLAVAVYACKKAGVRAGRSLLILGSGTIGLLCMMTAKAMGISNVCITDIVQERLNLAKQLGATHTLLSESRDQAAVAKEIHGLVGEDPDITLECTGTLWCQQLTIFATSPGGCVVYIGVGEAEATLPWAHACQREIDMMSIWRYDKTCFPIAIDLVATGRVKVMPLVTNRYPLEQTDDAIKMAASRRPGVLKVVVNCG